jgi:hypothetical protein
MNCISEYQCKSYHPLILQIGDILYSSCASASLTFRVCEDRARGLKEIIECG